jgi:hypothetical protein
MESQNSLPASITEVNNQPISRRKMLKLGVGIGVGALGITASTMGILEATVWAPHRAHVPTAAPFKWPGIQFDISNFIPPAQMFDPAGNVAGQGVLFRFGPVYTLFLTAQLTRLPAKDEQKVLEDALSTIETNYAFSPTGAFTFISYGLPYFNRLPASLVSSHMPRLLDDNTRFALEEAVPGPTDVSTLNTTIKKKTYNVPVVIEKNDLLITLRSDSLSNLKSISAWLQGSNSLNDQKVPSPAFDGLLTFTSSRLMFVQIGLPRKIADANKLPFANHMNPHSPMWMGFADQQGNGAGPAGITTFQGNASAKFTDTVSGDYFFDGSIQHLSHVIQDLNQFYAHDEPFTERCQYMFRSNPIPSAGNTDQFIDGGGPSFLDNIYNGVHDARANAMAINTFQGKHRMGHLTALQRSSRATDGTPIHIRMDGPGFDNMDVPGGSNQPKLQFTIFVPTANFFATMRKHQAALDLVEVHQVDNDDNGLERFITATRRQNFLVPPRAHRAFPLFELT